MNRFEHIDIGDIDRRKKEDDISCPACEWEGEPKRFQTTEGSDRDGNRGVLVTWLRCPECGENIDSDCPF